VRHPHEIDRNDSFPNARVDIRDLAAGAKACVVHHNVDSAEALPGSIERFLEVVRPSHIESYGLRSLTKGLRGRAASLAISVRKNDSRTQSNELPGELQPNAAGCTSDENDLVPVVVHGDPPLTVLSPPRFE
jgi:hypothetical protein